MGAAPFASRPPPSSPPVASRPPRRRLARVDGKTSDGSSKPSVQPAARPEEPWGGTTMNVFEHLVHEHRQAEQVMQQLKEKPQKRMFQQIMGALEQHLGGEEKGVYKALGKHKELHTHVLESIEEHRVVKRLLNEIAKLEPKDEVWQAKFKVLKESVEHHIQEEEGTIFPEAQRLIDQREAESLDARYSEAEKKIAA
jgi:hypothetical protein